MILLPMVASANAVEINGIYYNLISKVKTAEVTRNPNFYTGSIVIPETVVYQDVSYSVTSIGDRAFWSCSGLTSITISNSVTSIGEYAFEGCSGLKKVIVSDIAAWCGIKFGSNPLAYAKHLYSDENTEIKELVIPNSVTSIGDRAFLGCSGLTSVTIPNSVTSIEQNAFRDCSGLTSVTIPNSVTSIDRYAFSGCSGLTSVTIGNSVTSIGGGAFYECSGLTSVTIPNSVTSIGDRAFYCCSSLTSVTIPNSVTSIEEYTFVGCYGLTSIIIPDSVNIIRNAAFSGCSNLSSVTVGSRLKTIVSKAFQYCKDDLIVKVHIIDYEEFCSNDLMRQISEYVSNTIMMVDDEGDVIHEYIIPDGVTSVGYKAFFRCSGLTSVSIPNSVTSIGKQAFQYCNNLLSVTIPNSVNRIGDGAFVFCSGLESVTIGKNVTTIGKRAFADTDNLMTIVSLIEKPSRFDEGANAAFHWKTMTTGTLYVPIGTIDIYKSTIGWKDFRNIVEGNPSGIEQPLSNTKQIKIDNGLLTIQNIKNGTLVSVYNANGTFVGSTISQNEQAVIDTNMQPNSIAIVKIGEQSVKVIIK